MKHAILLAGGGTAGHVNPLLAVADQVAAQFPTATIRVLGTREGLEAQLVPERGYELDIVPRVPMPRRPSAAWFSFPSKLKAAIAAAKQVMIDHDIDVVIGFGGYVSTPAYLAARKLGIPIVIQEQNARPGLANRLGARWANRIALTFAQTPLKGGTVTGLPMRAEIAQLAADLETQNDTVRALAAKELGLDPARPVLLVTGGSLGAVNVNNTVAGAAYAILEAGTQILHLTGQGKHNEVMASRELLPAGIRGDYHVLEYLSQMHLAYAVANLVVCRSGAGTVCEIAALGIPAVFVPLPIGNGEQRLNAQELELAGAALVVADQDFTPQWVDHHVLPLLGSPQRLADMSAAARTVGQPHAAQKVVDLVAQAAGWDSK